MAPRSPEPRRLGIRTRLLMLLLPAVLALLALDSWNDYRALHDVVQDAYDQALLEPVAALADGLGVGADGAIRLEPAFAVQSMFEATRALPKHLHVGLKPMSGAAPEDTAGVSLLGVSDLPGIPAGREVGDPGGYLRYDAVYRGYPVRIVAQRLIKLDGRARPYEVLIQAAESTGQRDQAQAASLRQELLRDARMLVVVVLLVWVGVRFSLRPLERLRESVLTSPPGTLMPLDARQAPDEVTPLVEAINHHIASQRQMLATQAQFLADASHQLRTPLAIMLTQAAYALRETRAEPMREALAAIATQLQRSRRLSEQLLSLAHASQVEKVEGHAPPPGPVDLNGIARDVVLQYLPLAHEQNQDLGWVDARGGDDATDPDEAMVAPVMAHAEELHEVLSNLVHNAIKYTPRGGQITVAVRCDVQLCCVDVRDSGSGIAPERRESVFQRFQHPADHGSAATPGVMHGAGLGLAIARAYARHNHGDIMLADNPSPTGAVAGLSASLQLPRASDGGFQIHLHETPSG